MGVQINFETPLFYKRGKSTNENNIGGDYCCKFPFVSPACGGKNFAISLLVTAYDGAPTELLYYISPEDSLVNRNTPNKNTGKLLGTTTNNITTFGGTHDYTFMPNTQYYVFVYSKSQEVLSIGEITSTNGAGTITIEGETVSQVYGGNGVLGQNHTLQINQLYDGYSYRAILSNKNEEREAISFSYGADQLIWTPPIKWAICSTDSNKVEVNVVLENYYGEELVGQTTSVLYFKIPNSVRHNINFSIVQAEQQNYNFFIQNVTPVALSIDILGNEGYGATIVEKVINCGEKLYRGENPEFVLPNAGTNTVSGYVRDSRGRIYNFNLDEVEAEEYTFPSLNISSIYRYNEVEGFSDPEGTSAQVYYSCNYTNLKNIKNEPAITFYIEDIETGNVNTWQNNTNTRAMQIGDSCIIPDIALDKTYKIYARITDLFSTQSSNSVYLNSNAPTLEIIKTAKSIGIFHSANKARAIVSGVPIKLAVEPTEDDEVITKSYLDNKSYSLTKELSTSGWVDNTYTVEIENLQAKDIVIISPAASRENRREYGACNVFCSEQYDGELIFECDREPGRPLTVNIFIYKHTERIEILFPDFEYRDNNNGTYTLTGWKGTYKGNVSRRLIIEADNSSSIFL